MRKILFSPIYPRALGNSASEAGGQGQDRVPTMIIVLPGRGLRRQEPLQLRNFLCLLSPLRLISALRLSHNEDARATTAAGHRARDWPGIQSSFGAATLARLARLFRLTLKFPLRHKPDASSASSGRILRCTGPTPDNPRPYRCALIWCPTLARIRLALWS